ncbi:RrF2 family transcriptional regulator [Anaerophaga thermohalophila]|jgi:Rrf2 family protein|uniref:RrF2 family transcriptional regulator n=1 Tax=Anaerophaga thermohalophila TaxID=177400 RepID=UPI0003058101|nr:Rrf2 family transcriptional regulator [Anaerophaga thermohalophila]
MKFSKRVHYGLVFLMQLHYAWPGYKTVKEMAQSDGLPHKFLEGIASDFRKEGYVEVKRGAYGGYRLATPLKKITLLHVLRCLDPEWARQKDNDGRQALSDKQRTVSKFLSESSLSVEKIFGEITLDSLPALHSKEDALLYYI